MRTTSEIARIAGHVHTTSCHGGLSLKTNSAQHVKLGIPDTFAMHAGLNFTAERVQLEVRKDSTQRRKRGGVQSQLIGDCWIEQVMHRKYMEAAKELEVDLKKSMETLVLSRGTLDTQEWKKMSKLLFRYKGDGTVEVHKWITEISFDAYKSMTKLCRDNGLEEEHLPQWTKNVIGNMRDQVLEDVEARKGCTPTAFCG